MTRKTKILLHIHKNILLPLTLTQVATDLFSVRVLAPAFQDLVFSWICWIRKNFQVSLHSYSVAH